MPVTKWFPERIVKAVLDVQEKRMLTAVLVVQGNVKRIINRSNRDGKNPSAPGEPPKKVSGDLFRSIETQVIRQEREVIGVVGTNLPYARALELGFTGTDAAGRTRDMAPRPYLRPGHRMSLDKVKRILGGKK